MAQSKKTSKQKKKRRFIVDRNDTPYHLKRRQTNIQNSKVTQLIVIIMVLSMILGSFIGVIIYLF